VFLFFEELGSGFILYESSVSLGSSFSEFFPLIVLLLYHIHAMSIISSIYSHFNDFVFVFAEQKYADLKMELSRTERHILKEMGFICHVEHPHKFISNYLATLETPPELRQEAWNLANDRYIVVDITIFVVFVIVVVNVVAVIVIIITVYVLQLILYTAP
jgi:hypothetical protein